jgi:hypothetical protein
LDCSYFLARKRNVPFDSFPLVREKLSEARRNLPFQFCSLSAAKLLPISKIIIPGHSVTLSSKPMKCFTQTAYLTNVRDMLPSNMDRNPYSMETYQFHLHCSSYGRRFLHAHNRPYYDCAPLCFHRCRISVDTLRPPVIFPKEPILVHIHFWT